MEARHIRIPLNGSQNRLIQEHRLHGKNLLPAAGFVQLVCDHLQLAAPVALRQFHFIAPLFFAPQEQKELTIECAANRFILKSLGPQQQWLEHADGEMVYTPLTAQKWNLLEIRTRCIKKIAIEDYYDIYSNGGLAYGDYLRVIRELRLSEQESMAILQADSRPDTSQPPFLLHPAILDGAIQAIGSLSLGRVMPLCLPFYAESIEILSPVAGEAICYGRLREDNRPLSPVIKHDLWLCDNQGQGLVAIHNLCLKALGGVK